MEVSLFHRRIEIEEAKEVESFWIDRLKVKKKKKLFGALLPGQQMWRGLVK